MKKKHFRLTVRKKLVVSFLAVLLIPSLLIGIMAARSSKDNMRQQMLNSAQQSVATANSIISHSLQSKISDADFLTNALEDSTLQGGAFQALVPKLKQYLGLNPDVNDVYIGTEDGMTIHGNAAQNTGIDPREQEWYKTAMTTPGKISITPVIVDAKGNPEIIMSKTLTNRSGVLGISLNLDAIRTESSITIGKEGYVIVLDNQKKIVVHPNLKPAETGRKQLY
jgi:methyl-accepting chemotaxis protein